MSYSRSRRIIAPRLIRGLHEIADRYALALCDVWGVLHNGHVAFADAAHALIEFRKKGGATVLLSNAPRPSTQIATMLEHLGCPRQAWDAIVTSGDATRLHIQAHAGEKVFHLGPPRDRGVFEGVAVRFSGEEEADVVVCTGLFDDETQKAGDYRPMLERFLERNVPLICANPDLVVERGDALIDCAGAIAELYKAMGGMVVFCGKPHKPIYDIAFEKAAEHLGRPVAPSEALAIGDSVRTDLAGASAIGCGSLFVVGGIHAGELSHRRGVLDEEKLTAFLRDQGVSPDAAMLSLKW